MKKMKLFNWVVFTLCLAGGLYLNSCNSEEYVRDTETDSLIGKQMEVASEASAMLRCAHDNGGTVTDTVHAVCGEQTVAVLYAGRHIDIGTVTISNDDKNLYVEYRTEGGWVLYNTHLYVGSAGNYTATLVNSKKHKKFKSSWFEQGPPVNNAGNPMVGRFPYSTFHFPCVTTFTYVIPLDELGDSFMVAAHADALLLNNHHCVVQCETAWADGKRFTERGSWATYLIYNKQECKQCVFVPVSYPFISNWGQTTVGEIIVTNDLDSLYVTYKTDSAHFIYSTELYVGTLEDMPLNSNKEPDYTTTAFLKQGPFLAHQAYEVNYSLPLSGLPDCYYLATHAQVCIGMVWGKGGPEYTIEWLTGAKCWGWLIHYCTQLCE